MENDEKKTNVLCRNVKRIPFAGYIAIILSSLFFSFTTLFVKLLEKDMHPVQTTVVSYTVVSFIHFAILLFGDFDFKPFPGETKAMIARCLLGAATAFTTYQAVTLLKLGDATAIIMSSPIFVTVIAFIFLGESCELISIVLIATNLVGVILIAKPSFVFSLFSHTNETKNNSTTQSPSLYGLFLANAAAITNAGLVVALRKIKQTPIAVTIFWTAISIAALCSIYLIVTRDIRIPVTLKPYLLLTITTTCVLLAQYSLTLASKLEKAGPIALVRQVQVVFAYLNQVIILGQKLELLSTVGAAIIVCTVTVSGLYQLWRNSKETNNLINQQLTATSTVDTRIDSNQQASKINVKARLSNLEINEHFKKENVVEKREVNNNQTLPAT